MWRFAAAKAALDQAGEFVPVDQAERRNLIMVNPVEGNTYATTRNIVAAYQMVQAGEIARSHRHSPAALRLVVAAKPGTYTVVNGARVDMLPGDVVLTPSWSWHGHVNETDATSYWIDFLDVPFVQHAEAMFFEHHPDGLEKVTSSGSTPMRFPAGDALGPGKDAKIAEIAKDVMPTFGLHLVRLPAGTKAEVAKTTTNHVYAPVSGAVHFTAEDGTDQTLGPGDVIAVPCWHRHSYQAETDAVVFRVSDEPLLARLGLTRTKPE